MEDEAKHQDFVTVSRVTSGQTSKAFEERPEVEDYQILNRLAGGGMGSVWQAVQISTHRPVALKVIHTSLHSKRALIRFEREVELAARLEHPNIARVYDSGIHHKAYYYVMELLEEAQHLDHYVQNQKLSPRQTLELMQSICMAVQYAHQHGIIHRDLKPSNILVTPDGQPHILDFGLAKDLLAEQQDRTVSLDGDLMGTPAYMSPEQAAGDLDQVDTRTDVYALGIILYQLLTGRFPYDVSGRLFDILDNIQNAEPKRPTMLNPDLNIDVEAILYKALAKNPEQRYASVSELSHDINCWLQGLPIMAKSSSTIYLLRKIIGRHRYTSVVATLLFLIIMSFSGIGFQLYVKSKNAQAESQTIKTQFLTEAGKSFSYSKELAFIDALNHWQHNDIDQALFPATFLGSGSREKKAITYLMDPNRSPDGERAFRANFPEDSQWFADFCIAEDYLKRGLIAQARDMYQSSYDRISTLKEHPWSNFDQFILKHIKARLFDLGATHPKVMPQDKDE